MHFLFLSTSRLLLRPLLKKDLDDVWRAANTPGLPDYMYWILPETKDELTTLPQNEIVRMVLGYGFNVVVCNHAGTVLGRVFLNQRKSGWELGYWLLPEYRGKGYMTEACNAMLAFAFEEIKVDKITAYSVVQNNKSTNVLERLGFTLIETKNEGFKKADKSYDLHEFRITNEGYTKLRKEGDAS